MTDDLSTLFVLRSSMHRTQKDAVRSRLRQALVAVAILLSVLVPGTAQLIDGSKNPELIPDSEAYVLFFLVMRTMPPPHWDMLTKVNYMKPSGFTQDEVLMVIRAADDYFVQIAPLDAEIKRINDSNLGHNDAPEVLRQVNPLQDQKDRILQSSIISLYNGLPPKGVPKLQEHLLRVKRGTRMWVPGTQVPSKQRLEHRHRPAMGRGR